MDKHEVSAVLEQMAEFMELKGENPFKIRAYHNANRVIDALTDSIEELVAQGTLTQIKGIGSGIAEKITELVKTGRCKEFEALKKSFPNNFLEMLEIPGLGAKKKSSMTN